MRMRFTKRSFLGPHGDEHHIRYNDPGNVGLLETVIPQRLMQRG
jgi:hypothetical protein